MAGLKIQKYHILRILTNFNENLRTPVERYACWAYTCGALRMLSVRLWSGAPSGVRVFLLISQNWALNMHIRQWNSKVLGKSQILGISDVFTPVECLTPVERCAHRRMCFWLISPKKDMHIREWNNKVLGKSVIKRGMSTLSRKLDSSPLTSLRTTKKSSSWGIVSQKSFWWKVINSHHYFFTCGR